MFVDLGTVSVAVELAWVSGLPKGLRERRFFSRFFFFRFSLAHFPPPKTPDTQAPVKQAELYFIVVKPEHTELIV